MDRKKNLFGDVKYNYLLYLPESVEEEMQDGEFFSGPEASEEDERIKNFKNEESVITQRLVSYGMRHVKYSFISFSNHPCILSFIDSCYFKPISVKKDYMVNSKL